MLSLQRRQVKEVLDEDTNAYRRVLDRERQQVKVFDETIKPKAEADLQTEVSFEKDVEKLQILLERRINAVEEIIRSREAAPGPGPAGRFGPARTAEAASEALSSAPLVASWNGIVRSLSDPSVTQRVRDSMKSKLTEIQGQVNALVYGFNGLIYALSGPGITDVQFSRFVPRMMSTQAVYSLIQKQIFTGQFSMIRAGDIETQLADIKAGLPRGAGTIGERIDRILASPVMAPFYLNYAADAANRKRAILEEQRGRRLEDDEFQLLRASIFGAKNPKIPIDPALAAELERIGRVETAAKEEIGRREERLPEPYRPPPTYSMLSPEYIAGVTKTADEFRDASLRTDRDALAAILAKYDIQADGTYLDNDDLAGGEEEKTDDVGFLIDDLVELRLALAKLEGRETTKLGEEERLEATLATLNGNRRSTIPQKQRFVRNLKALMSTYLDEKKRLLQIERDERVEKAKLIPKIGNAKPRFGRLGMWFDDSRNEMFADE